MDRLEDALSLERFARYLKWAGGDRDRALELYALNTRVSEALYTPLQMLEVALRNRIHTIMSGCRHEWWFADQAFLQVDHQQTQVDAVMKEIGAEPPGQVVASLTFSFWTAMVGAPYENLWQTDLHKIARKPNGKGLTRKNLSRPLSSIRTLRNRIAHHEPIINWSLDKRHAEILQLTEWLSPAAAAWCVQLDRFDQVWPKEPISLIEDE